MKADKLIDAIGEVKDAYVADADKQPALKKPFRARWIVLPLAAALGLIAVILLLPTGRDRQVSVGGVMRTYTTAVDTTAEAIEWPWEYMTIYEQYNTLRFEGREYTVKTGYFDGFDGNEDIAGETLGEGTGVGYDIYTDRQYEHSFPVLEIKGISPDLMVAAEMDGRIYTFQSIDYDPPATLGEVLDHYSLPELLPLRSFAVVKDGREKESFSISDDTYIWQVLSECREAPFIEDNIGGTIGENRISFTATSPALGVYKQVFNVAENGFITTNIFNWLYSFDIGEEAASAIISYAKENARPADKEQYLYSVAGTLTDIGPDYILVDDSILCANKRKGITFKVMTNDLRIRRCLDFENISTKSIVVVYFTRPVDVEAGYVIDSAVSMVRGSVNDGGVTVAE